MVCKCGRDQGQSSRERGYSTETGFEKLKFDGKRPERLSQGSRIFEGLSQGPRIFEGLSQGSRIFESLTLSGCCTLIGWLILAVVM